MNRAERRRRTLAARARTIKIMRRLNIPLEPRFIGHWLATHNRPCSCEMCSPRKGEGKRENWKGRTPYDHVEIEL